jgi:hypothetical protein
MHIHMNLKVLEKFSYYSLRPTKHENLIFRDQISGAVKLRMYPSFILHRAHHSSYLQCSLKLPDTAGGWKST